VGPTAQIRQKHKKSFVDLDSDYFQPIRSLALQSIWEVKEIFRGSSLLPLGSKKDNGCDGGLLVKVAAKSVLNPIQIRRSVTFRSMTQSGEPKDSSQRQLSLLEINRTGLCSFDWGLGLSGIVFEAESPIAKNSAILFPLK
jgi:hypothetical protein